MQKSGETVEFVYNENGLRVQKTATSTGVTKYTLHGKNIVHMTQGSNNLHFFYDASNKPAMVVYNGVKYAYVHNLQGDIVAILDSNGTAVVQYKYDAWGKPISKTGTMATSLGELNPFRYRGYVYDEETGFYYLRQRFYTPRTLRFLSADSVIGSNLFTYCSNSPIILMDQTGRSPTSARFSMATWDSTGGGNRYNRSEAVNYAREWSHGRNKGYYSYGKVGGDCTNYSSQCVYAGGIPMDEDWKSFQYEKSIWGIVLNPIAWFENNDRYTWDVSPAWSTVSKQYEYFSNHYCGGIVEISNPDEIAEAISNNVILPGDLMYFKNNAGLHHSVIITKVEDGMIYYAGHTNNCFDKPLSEGMGSDSIVIIHIVY